jgi:hypothetical protein
MFSLKLKKHKELHISNRTRHAPIRHGLLMKIKNDELLILDELAYDMELISNIDSKK